MPIAKTENLDIYYEIIGQGEPLVMIRGISSNVDHWYEQVPVLSKKYQLLIFDNRGIARTSAPGGSFSPKDMAADTVASGPFVASLCRSKLGAGIRRHWGAGSMMFWRLAATKDCSRRFSPLPRWPPV